MCYTDSPDTASVHMLVERGKSGGATEDATLGLLRLTVHRLLGYAMHSGPAVEP